MKTTLYSLSFYVKISELDEHLSPKNIDWRTEKKNKYKGGRKVTRVNTHINGHSSHAL